MLVFFSSDFHFGHKRILEYEPRRGEVFGDIKNHDNKLIENWNSKVKPEDLIWVLGDMFFCGNTYAKEIMGRLQGRKRLIIGNHDNRRSYTQWEKLGFEVVLDAAKIKIDGQEVWLSHFPYQLPWWKKLFAKHYDKRYENVKLKSNGSWLLHGHCHSNKVWGNKMINVGVDVNGYFPVSEVDLIKKMRKGVI